MIYKITAPKRDIFSEIVLPASKSISNRALIMGAVGKAQRSIRNLAQCDDTDVLVRALESDGDRFDVGAAGTSMRFMTAYLASRPGDWSITGSERMKHRPIAVLVDALKALGAEISYEENAGFPPLRIRGKELKGGHVVLDGGVSSQYISALLMVAPSTKGRRLFGWLPVPDGEDFVYYCRVNEALNSADKVVSSILSFVKGDAALGVSCPRKDRFLRSALVKAGFSPVSSLWHLNILNRHWCV